MSAACDICGQDFDDVPGEPLPWHGLFVSVHLVSAPHPVQTVLAFVGGICGECTQVARDVRDAFHRSCQEQRGDEPVPIAKVQTSWWRRLFGGA